MSHEKLCPVHRGLRDEREAGAGKGIRACSTPACERWNVLYLYNARG